MDAAGKHVCSLCMHCHAHTCMFTFLPSNPYVNTRFHFCPTAGKVNQVDREKMPPGAETAFLCLPRSFFTLSGWGVLNYMVPSFH